MDFQKLDDLQLREKKELYPPRFVITFTGSSTAEDSHAVFTFQGATEEIVKEIILTKGTDHVIFGRILAYLSMSLNFVFKVVVCSHDNDTEHQP